MADRQVILVGGFLEIIELCEEANCEIVGIIDAGAAKCASYPFLGADREAASLSGTLRQVPLVIAPDAPAKRKALAGYYSGLGFRFATLVHPDAHVSKSARLGVGAVVQFGVNVSSKVQLGDLVKLNTYANVMHEVRLGNYATVAPNAVLLGRITVEDLAYIGSHATILPGLTVGTGAVVGAGSVVTRAVPDGKVVVGCPAREVAPKDKA